MRTACVLGLGGWRVGATTRQEPWRIFGGLTMAGDTTRVLIRVHPGSSVAVVGGERDGALVIRVTERAVDGRATDAALRALAKALGIRPGKIRLIYGATSRTKLVEITGLDAIEAVRDLRAGHRQV